MSCSIRNVLYYSSNRTDVSKLRTLIIYVLINLQIPSWRHLLLLVASPMVPP
jgi:hypothetical protein